MPSLFATVEVGTAAERWPALGLGTWHLGESERTTDREVALLRRALEIGYRLFDTAEMYGEGGAEQVLGRALAHALREPGIQRDELRVVTKAYPHHGTPAGLRRACDASRRRLQLDTIDLYLLHWRGGVALAQTVHGFEQLQQRGWIRHWGVSNFDADDLDELLALPGGQACASDQVYYSLSERGAEFELLPRLRQRNVPLMAYCPIDGGRIVRHRPLAELAATLGLSAAQLALAWLLHQPGVIVIPKAGSEPHLLENWRSRDARLPAAVLAELDSLFPPPTCRKPLAIS